MLKRTLVGVLMVVAVAGAIATRFWQTEVFDIFVLLLSVCCAYEIIEKNSMRGKSLFIFPIMLSPLAVFVCNFFAPSTLFVVLYEVIWLLTVVCACLVIEIVFPKTKRGKIEIEQDPEMYSEERLLERTKRTIGYSVYPSFLLGAFYGINAFGLELGLVALLVVFGVSALSDTFAFFFGIMLKGKRLCPEISPKKGVPGMIFGFIGGLVASFALFAFFRYSNLIQNPIETMPIAKCIVMFALLGIVGSLLTQVGDLFESALKRNLKIKDFGNLFPGHGGFMDRVDGQMFNVVFVYIMFLLFI